MTDLNKVFIAGNLTKNPELRYTPSNSAVTTLGVAINSSYTDKQGQKVENTVFVDVVVWNKQAENCCKYLSKGKGVLIEGSLDFEQWEQDGQKRSRLKVKANRVQFLSKPDQQPQSQASQPSMQDDFPENDIPF